MDTTSVSQTFRSRSINGWALEALIHMDAVHPSILRFALQASRFRRQAIFLTLSALHFSSPKHLAVQLGLPESSPEPLADIAHALMTWRVRDIVHALHGPIDGLIGSLNKLGDAAFEASQYRTLVSLLSRPEHQARAKVLRKLNTVTPHTLDVLLRLDTAFVCVYLVQALGSGKQAEQFTSGLDLIQQVVPNVTTDELLASIKSLGPSSCLGDWMERWVAKGQFHVSCPIQDDEEWVGLRTGKAMADVAARYANCLRSKINLVAVGRAFYLEYKPAPAIVELYALSRNQWLLEGIYGPQNGRVERSMKKAILQKIKTAGILVPSRLAEAQRLNKAAKLLGIYPFEMDDLEDDPDDPEIALEQQMQAA